MKGYMMIAIVNRGTGDSVMAAARAAGAPGGTIANATGTATSTIMAALGLGDKQKEILYSMIREDQLEKVEMAVSSVKTKGVVLFLDCRGKEIDVDNAKWTMIEVISEKGYAEDIMAAARKAGAKGGSIIIAHGTAKDEDAKFFGRPIVNDKEMLIIVVERDKADAIESAIESMEVLNEKGKAILFRLPVTSFKNLG